SGCSDRPGAERDASTVPHPAPSALSPRIRGHDPYPRTMIDFEHLARPGIRNLRAYDPGHDLVALRRRFAEAQLVELGSNENPYGAGPAVRQAIADALPRIHVYPDPLGGDLKRALAALHRVDVSHILLGNGSHELLMQ